jgi:hypothetical protein
MAGHRSVAGAVRADRGPGRWGGRFTSRHHQSGTLFDALTSDSALTRTMVLVTHQGVAEVAPRPAVSGVYHDRWRKTPTGWRLAHRAAHVDRDPGLSPVTGKR